jgi:mannose-6-phosphate isomerase-like protein (cupin superfamily)
LTDKFSLFDDYWNPRVIAQLNGQLVKLVKFQGEFVWHTHDNEDELFFVVKGSFQMQYKDHHHDTVHILNVGEGEMIIVPRGTEHCPLAPLEVQVLLFEPDTTINTGDASEKRTRLDLNTL